MNKILVIHPSDRSTDFLKYVYKGKGYDVINSCDVSKEYLKEAIEKHDKILMMGHGTGYGLLNPKHGGYLIDDSFADTLAEKETLSIWCYSDNYFRRHGIKGFHTGMIISEVMEELIVLGKVVLNRDEILENMEFMSKLFNDCIEKSPKEIKEYMTHHYNLDDLVSEFNRGNFKVL